MSDKEIRNLITDRGLVKKLEDQLDAITKNTITIWDTLVGKYKLDKETRLLSWFMYDDRFTPGGYDRRFERWTQKGITAMCTIVNGNQLEKFEKLVNRFGLEETDWYRYLQVKAYHEKEIKSETTF